MAKAVRSRGSNVGLVLGLGAVGFLAYAIFGRKATAATAVLPGTVPPAPSGALPGPVLQPIAVSAMALPELPGAGAVTGAQVAAATSFWGSLTPVGAIDSGYINFPDGTQAAAATFGAGNTRMDGLGNYYVQWAGQVFQIGSQDADGNWPATPVGAA